MPTRTLFTELTHDSNFKSLITQRRSLTVHKSASSYSFFIDKCVGYFNRSDKTMRLGLTSVSTEEVAKEGHPKSNPRPGQGLNPGPSG